MGCSLVAYDDLVDGWHAFIHTGQKLEHDGGKSKWQPPGMADRTQWTIYLAMVAVIVMLPVLAGAISPSYAAGTASAEKPSRPASGLTVAESKMPRIKAPERDIANLRDPFESYLTVLEKQSKERLETRSNLESNHAPEPLEAFDLSTLKLVAIMQVGDNRAAMVEDNEGKGYVVRKGNYIGHDNGRVVEITQRSVTILEDELNAAGTIVKRKATLTLNEVNQ